MDACKPIFDQRIEIAIGLRVDAAAAAAIAAARPAAWDVLFTPERGDAVAALAGVHFDGRFVYELHT
jgi:hypothetical protein